jgi:dephospho-CoA kinase
VSDNPTATVWIVGPIAAGKSTHVARLAELSGWPVYAIDDYRSTYGKRAWEQLREDLAAEPGSAIVESVIVPADMLALAKQRRALVCRVTCSEAERKRRLSKRGWKYSPPPEWTDTSDLSDVEISGDRHGTTAKYQSILLAAADVSGERQAEVSRKPVHSRVW